MTKILFVSFFTTTLTMTALSQTQNQPENTPICNLSLSQAPAIRGIRLGMKPDEWLKLFPGSAQDERIKAIIDEPSSFPRYGVKYITFLQSNSQNPFNYLPSDEFSGIDYVSLTLFDNQIIGISISYAPYPHTDNPWDDVAQLITIFSETFNLPQVSAWNKTVDRAVLKCAGFELILNVGNRPSAYLNSLF